MKRAALLLFLALAGAASAQMPGRYDAVHSGPPWFDQQGLPVSAHGAGIVREGDTWYLFGEAHRDMTNAFAGFHCYSSTDLVNWRFESVVLPVQASGALGPNTVALFRKDDTYYFLGSNLTGWERNDNHHYTAKSLAGPWTKQGLVAPPGTLTWNSQVTFVLPVTGTHGTTFMFMGDR